METVPSETDRVIETRVLILGGGVTGTGLARDLALRGVPCLLAERHDINAGASGANHGLLHSGARYVSGDRTTATECRAEAERLKRLAPHCIEDTGGLFVAVAGDDENYVADFPGLCAQCGIPAEPLSIPEALDLEPVLSEDVIAAFGVQDAAIDPFKLSLDNLAQARSLGCGLLRHTEAVGFKRAKGRVVSVCLLNRKTGGSIRVEADTVVNATGAWARQVAALADVPVEMHYSKGSLLILDSRISNRVINRLRPSSNADIVVPGGTVSILGTTSARIDTLEDIRPTVDEIDMIIDEAVAMIPSLATTRYLRAYSGVRPLVGASSEGDDRNASRGFALVDHERDGLENFITITGGKLTTYRLMAEKTADLVCRKLGASAPCRTITEPLPPSGSGKWTEPGLSPRLWLKNQNPSDLLLCECEMVPRSAIDGIVADLKDPNDRPGLRAVALRSRVGKGTCQGAFCGVRIAAHLYDTGVLNRNSGLSELRSFFSERWKGIRPLLWGASMIQEELQEALHCGLFCLELESEDEKDGRL